MTVSRNPSLGWLKSIASALLGAVGIGTLLYGTGFLVLRSHTSFLGLWPGIPWGAQQITEEGGRFYFHLASVPLDWLIPVSWSRFLVIVAAGAAALLVGRWSPLLKPHYRRASRWVRHRGSHLVPITCALVAFLATAVVVETLWVVLTSRALLLEESLSNPLLTDEGYRASLYRSIVLRTLFGVLIGVSLVPLSKAVSGGWTLRAVIAGQWLLVVASLLGLPMAYGALVMPTDYPRIEHDTSPSDETLLLLTVSDGSWITWSREKRVVRVLSATKRPVAVGAREPLYERRERP